MTWLDPFADPSASPLSTVRLADARQAAEREVESLRIFHAADSRALAQVLYRVGQFALALGDGQGAVQALVEAIKLDSTPAAHVGLGQALRLVGQYPQAQVEFASVLPGSSDNAALSGLALLGLARCACDSGEWDVALAQCNKALPILEAEKLPYYEASARLKQTELYIRMKQDSGALSALEQIDAQLTAAKIQWLRPEWWALKARLALAQGDPRAAEKAARRGLGAVDDRADVQILAALYRALAAALERQRSHTGIEDARDSRQRSVVAAQTYAARLELARALHEFGLHFKLYANRPTLRARGSGYLYEADRLFQTMGINVPLSSGTTVPLL